MKIKESTLKRAIGQKWSLTQIQAGEDYIDSLTGHRATARRPVELPGRHARTIREIFKYWTRPSRK